MAFFDVIKHEPSNDTLVFKHPVVDFNRKAKLIVHANQEAIVLMNGLACKAYPPGKHELYSENRPGLKHVAALFTGGELANHCEVYFVNKLFFSNIPWVTTAMDIQEHTMQNYQSFWSEGFFDVQIADSNKLFKAIGNVDFFGVNELKDFFRDRISSVAKEFLSIAMAQMGIAYGEINSHNTYLSQNTMSRVQPYFDKIGLALEEFRFCTTSMDKDAVFEEHRKRLSERSGDKILNTNYVQRRTLDAMEAQANNQGTSGAVSSTMAGAAFGMGYGQTIGGMAGSMMQSVINSQSGFGNMGQPIGSDNSAGIVQPHSVQSDSNNKRVCSRCHRELKSDWNACPWCDTEPQNVCPNCNYELPDGAIRCPICSTKLHR